MVNLPVRLRALPIAAPAMLSTVRSWIVLLVKMPAAKDCSDDPANSTPPFSAFTVPLIEVVPAMRSLPKTVTEVPGCMVILFDNPVPETITGYLLKPEGINTFEVIKGMPPHDQLLASCQTVLMAPVQIAWVLMEMLAVVV